MTDSATPWTVAHQASLSFIISQNLLKLMSIESVMLSNHMQVSDSLQHHGLSLLGSSVHGFLQAKNTGVGCHSLPQGIFPGIFPNPGI